jgi:hypothetical protein
MPSAMPAAVSQSPRRRDIWRTSPIFPGGHGDYLGEVVATQRHARYPELTARAIEEFLDCP